MAMVNYESVEIVPPVTVSDFTHISKQKVSGQESQKLNIDDVIATRDKDIS